MDHTKIETLNQLPLLTYSLVLTCFYATELQNSVRGHQDLDFQRFQQIYKNE